MSTMLASALAYAERLRWPVFPLHGKAPTISKANGRNGHLDATTDPTTIRKWWRAFPDANIGISCIGSGFLAVDIVPRDGGNRTFAELLADHPPLPHTPRQLTGGGGLHILFTAPGDVQVRGSLGPGVQVKYVGYVVAAPSIHPDTGRRYAWESDFRPSRLPLAPIPTWLTDLILLPPTPKGVARPVIEESDGWGAFSIASAAKPLA